MSEHNTADLTAQASKDFQASRGALAWLIVHLEEDGSYSTHKVPIAQSASLMTTAVQKKWRALTSTKSRVGNRLLLRKVVVEIVDIVPIGAGTRHGRLCVTLASAPTRDQALTTALAHPGHLKAVNSDDFFRNYQDLSSPAGSVALPAKALIFRWETDEMALAGVRIAMLAASFDANLAVKFIS